MKHNFARFKTIQSYGDNIQNDMMTMYMTNNEQIQFAKSIREFLSDSAMAFLKGKEINHNAFESGTFLLPSQLIRVTRTIRMIRAI